MVVAQISVGEHEVADLLGRAQAPAVADHQPGFGPQHGEVVGDGLGVRGPDADVDQGDPHAVGREQVVGRHLVAPPGRIAQLRVGIFRRAVEKEPAGAGQRGVDPLADLPAGPVDELVDVAVIVREQDVALEVLGRGAGVMGEAREREIGPEAVEQRQRHGFARPPHLDAVGQFVADQRQLGGREVPRELRRGHAEHRRAALRVEHVGEGDFLPRRAAIDFDAVVGLEQPELLVQVVGKELWLGHGGRISARLVQPPESARAVAGKAAARETDPQLGVAIAAVVAALGRRGIAGAGKVGDIGAQALDGGVVDGGQLGNGGFGIHAYS